MPLGELRTSRKDIDRQVAPLAGAAVHIIRGQFGQSKRERQEDEFGVDANVTIHHETNGRH